MVRRCELKEDDPERKFKARYVFEGSWVRGERGDHAKFSELSSNPATLEAPKATDAYGLLPGHDIEQSDAEQAYCQTTLGLSLDRGGDASAGAETWARLPRGFLPADWPGHTMRDPVVPLALALYGHPDSGGYWEMHSEDHLLYVGFEVVENWRSVYYHPRLRLLLMVYVDDFKMSGPKQTLAGGWKLTRGTNSTPGLKIVEPGPFGKCLGCVHRVVAVSVDGRKVRGMEYDCCDFMRSCVEAYRVAVGNPDLKLRKVATPCLPPEPGRVSSDRGWEASGEASLEGEWG